MFLARITIAYERSSAGAVMLKIATMVSVDPIPIKFRAQEKKTISQTALTGVRVYGLTLEKNLGMYRQLDSQSGRKSKVLT